MVYAICVEVGVTFAVCGRLEWCVRYVRCWSGVLGVCEVGVVCEVYAVCASLE